MQIESIFIHSTKPSQSSFGKSPKPFDTINVGVSIGKFIFSMIDTKMFSISDIDESIVTTPSVILDDAFHGDTTSDDSLQRSFGAVRDNFSIDFAIAFKNAKDDGFARSTLASFSFKYTAKKNLVSFNFSRKRRLGFTKFCDALSNRT